MSVDKSLEVCFFTHMVLRDEDESKRSKGKRKKPIPFDFILDELDGLDVSVRPMFGCHAIYVGPKITLIVRERESEKQDNGVWLATTVEHHQSLAKDFPSMRSIKLFETEVTGWQVLPSSSKDFERSVLKACALIRKGDPRIGKIPKGKKKRAK